MTLVCLGSFALAENIDPGESGDQYAWGENVGWLNAEPLGNGGPGVEVQDFALTGWMWGETIGWVSLSCENTSSCSSTSYGVTNDGFGSLGGYAWGENVGWIQFHPFGAPAIDASTGDFSGYAWSENVGWIHLGSTGPIPFRVKTKWCQDTASKPGTAFTLTASKVGGLTLSWTSLATATWYEAVRGDLSRLRSTAGDFASATLECIADKVLSTALTFGGPDPPPGQGDWFLVRGSNCLGHGTYDTGASSQIGTRDAEIAASGDDCE